MRTIDIFGLAAYLGIVINMVFIAYNLNKSVQLQIKHRILLWNVLFTSNVVTSSIGAIGLFFYNRLVYISQGEQTPLWVTDASVYFWIWLCLSLTGISYLYGSRNMRKYIPLGKKKELD